MISAKTTMLKPEGKVRVVRCVAEEAQDLVMRTLIVCEDEAGKTFSFPACDFVSEISPYNADQGMPLSEWITKRYAHIESQPNGWRKSSKIDYDQMVLDYMAGVKYND